MIPSARRFHSRVALIASTLALLVQAAPATAQHGHHEQRSPYAGQQTREIKSLSPERIEGLESGEGLGYAKAAELNGLPGPAHVLDMREALGLDEFQARAVEAVFASMRAEAVALGGEIIRLEGELDVTFRNPDPSPDRVRTLTAQIAAAEGRLRAVHLLAHLRIRPLLTDGQVETYGALRGYREDR